MITIEELKLQFGVRNISKRGACIVIPKGRFNVEWEQPLREQNADVEFNVDLPGGISTLIKLKPEHLGERVVYAPPEPKRKHQPVAPSLNPERRWKPEEDELIIAMWNRRRSRPEIYEALHKRFPNRTVHAVNCRTTRLIQAGKIPSRWHKGERKKKPEKIARAGFEPEPLKPSPPSPQEPLSTPSSTPISTPAFTINTVLTIQLSVNCNDRNAVANFLEIIEKMGLKKKETSP